MDERILTYISDSLAKGYTETQVRQALQSRGWKEEDINTALFLAMNQPPIGDESVPQQTEPTAMQNNDSNELSNISDSFSNHVSDQKLSFSDRILTITKNPKEFFRNIEAYSLVDGLVFNLILLTIPLVSVLGFVFFSVQGGSGLESLILLLFSVIFAAVSLVMIVITIPLQFLLAFLAKLVFSWFGAKTSYKNMYNIFAFSAAPMILSYVFYLVPYVGPVLSTVLSVWSIVVLFIGLTEHFDLSLGKVLGALVVFFFLVGILFGAILLLILVAGVGAFAALIGSGSGLEAINSTV